MRLFGTREAAPRSTGRRSHNLRHRTAAAAVLAALSMAATACGGGSGDSGDTGGTGGKPVDGGTLTLGVGLQLADFDPFNGINQNYVMDKTLYSYLITYDSKLQPHPDMATSWEFAPDNASVTIKLRTAEFADGTPVTANDVVVGVQRALNPQTGLTQGGVASFIRSATAVDDHTVRVDFNQPTTQDRVLDWMFYFPVVQAAKDDPTQLKTAPAGSGPFVVDSFQPGNSLTLKRNPHYFGAKPHLDKVVYRFFDDQDAMVAALQSGDVQGTVWQELRYDQQLKGQYDLVDGSSSALTLLFYLNPQIAPFDDVDCRKAVMKALDRQKILTATQGTTGQIVPGPFPPTSPVYDKTLLKQNGFDLAAAKKGIASSCSTTTATGVVQPSAGVSTAMTILQADLKQAGFTLNLQNMDNASYIPALRTGKIAATMYPTVNPFRSPASLATNRAFSGGAENYWWAGKGVPGDYVTALTAVQQAQTPEQQKAAAAQFNQALLADSWATGMYTQIDRFALGKDVHGFAFSPSDQLVLTGTWVSSGQ